MTMNFFTYLFASEAISCSDVNNTHAVNVLLSIENYVLSALWVSLTWFFPDASIKLSKVIYCNLWCNYGMDSYLLWKLCYSIQILLLVLLMACSKENKWVAHIYSVFNKLNRENEFKEKKCFKFMAELIFITFVCMGLKMLNVDWPM